MQTINKEFNINNLNEIKNLIAVLGKIRGKEFRLRTPIVAGKMSSTIWTYIRTLQKANGLRAQSKLTPETIEMINRLAFGATAGVDYDEGMIREVQEWLMQLEYQLEEIELEKGIYGDSTREAIKTFQERSGLEVTGDLDDKTIKALKMAYEKALSNDDGGNTSDQKHQVKGSVPLAYWEGGTVEVYSKKMRGKEELLATQKEFKNGFYELTYQVPSSETKEGCPNPVHLVVKLLDKEGMLVEAKTFLNAKPVTIANFAKRNTVEFQPTRLAQKIEQLKCSLGELSLAKIEQTVDNPDISFLMAETGLKEHEIIEVVLAHKLADDLEEYDLITADVINAFVEQHAIKNLPRYMQTSRRANWNDWMDGYMVHQAKEGLLLLSVEEQGQILDAALSQNILPVQSALVLEKTKEQLAKARKSYILNTAHTVDRATLKDFLGWSKIEEKDYDDVINLFVSNNGFKPAFVSALLQKENLSKGTRKSIQNVANLGEMADYNLPMMHLLKKQTETAPSNKYNYFDITAPRDFAKWETADWKEFLKKNEGAIPRTIHIEDKDEKINFYTVQIQEKTEKLFPDVALVAKVYRSDKHQLKNIKEVAQFIDKQTDYNLKTTHIDVFAKENKGLLSPDAIEEIKVLKRIHNISASAEVGQGLLDNEIYSAKQVYEMGESNLAKALNQKGNISAAQVAQTFNNAANAYSSALSIAGTYSFNQLNPKAIIQLTNDGTPSGTPEGLTNGLPDLENLFGSLDYCECKHCKSVYSPAAYLADLLRFLSQKPAMGGKTAKDILIERRPDIDDIGLNCENAHKPLPYIDLVCEVLENRLKHGSYNDNPNFAHDTTWTAEELKAMPEHEREAAYEILIKKPTLHKHFNLWQSQTDLFLEKLGLPYSELMQAWQTPNSSIADKASIAAAYFDLSTGAKDFILNKNPLLTIATINSLWQQNLDYSGATVTTKSVEEFLQTTRLSYDELIELLQLEFINPNGQTIIERPIDTCAISAQHLKNGLSITFFTKVSCFLRLWRATDWEMWELDLLIRSGKIGNGFLNETCLVNLHQVHQLQTELGLSVEELIAFYEDINITPRRDALNNPIVPIYERLFLNPTIEADASIFAANIIASAHSVDETYASTVAAAIEIDEEVAFGLLSLNVSFNNSLAKLSWIYRKALLSKSLQLSIDELDLLSELSGINPFVHIGATQQILTYKKWMDENGLDLSTIEYLITNNSSALKIEEVTIGQYLEAQRTALDELRNQLRDTTRTKKEILRSFLGQIAPLDNDENKLQDAIDLIFEEGRWSPPSQSHAVVLNPSTTTNPNQGTPILIDYTGFIQGHLPFVRNTYTATQKLKKQNGLDENERAAYVLGEIEYYLSEQIVLALVSENLNLTEAAVQTIWKLKPDGSNSFQAVLCHLQLLNGAAITRTHYSAMYEAYDRLHKMALLVQLWDLGTEDLELFIAHYSNSNLNILHLENLPIDNNIPNDLFVKLVEWGRFVVLHKKYSVDDSYSLGTLWNSTNLQILTNQLAKWTGWDLTILEQLLLGPDNLGLALTNFQNATTYEKIQTCIRQQEQLGVEVALIRQWTNRAWDLGLPATDNSVITHQMKIAQQVRQTLKSKFSNEQWLTILVPIQDQLRIQKRDALLSCFLETEFKSTNEIYQDLLIDVEMSPCQMTSRIKEAISSIQLLVQRAFMNLEQNIKIPKTDNNQIDNWAQWKWMQNYRVWEANRKVFLYPENWIEPELRDDKTPFFKELEEELLQNDVTNESVEAAFANYLDKLDGVANLDIVGISTSTERYKNILARTKEFPHIYYHRQYREYYDTWTAWEKVGVDIKGNHAIPLTLYDVNYIFWLEILEKPTKLNKVPATREVDVPTNAPETPPYKEIQLAWSFQTKDGWTAKTVSKKKIIHPWPRPEYALHLKPALRDEGLWLDIFVSTAPEFNDKKFYDQYSGTFKKMTDTAFDETKAPWHSSGFLFERDRVKKVKLFGVSGEYYLPEDVEPQDYFDNSGGGQDTPLNISNVTLTYKNYNASQNNSGSIILEEYEIDTNYGKYRIEKRDNNGVELWINLGNGGVNGKIAETGYDSPPTRIVGLSITSRTDHTPKIHLAGGSVYSATNLTLLNNLIATGDETMAYVPPQNSSNNYIVVPTTATNTDSYIFVHNSFGEDGRKIERLTNAEQEHQAYMPLGMHFEYNHLVKHNINANMSYAFYLILPRGGSNYLITGFKNYLLAHYKVTIPMVTPLWLDLSTIFGGPPNPNYTPYKNFPISTFEDNEKVFFLRYDETNTSNEYVFYPLYHPYTKEFISELKIRGIEGLLNRKMQIQPVHLPKLMSDSYDFLAGSRLADPTYEKEIVDFNSFGSYAMYNWEIFFHIPLMIATNLSKNQRFEEAMRWFHFIFNPTNTETDLNQNVIPSPQKYWITKQFYEHNDLDYQNQQINNILNNINDYDKEVAEWKNNPFKPHLIARKRPVAYQRAVVMKYIDNLIAWGDQLFRRETIEAVNQARLLYVVAHELLGERPQEITSVPITTKTYEELETSAAQNPSGSIDIFGNTDVLVAAEGLITTDNTLTLSGEIPIFKTKYFCIPHNEKLVKYWDLVEDRLFKIRHCMNIDGVVRQLPLFAPPIDPALLVNATAMGLDLGTVLDDMSAPRSNYKYRVLARTATQFCSEVKSLGQRLLSALQSKDAEGMALLQSVHSLKVLDATIDLKELQIEETIKNIESLTNSKESALFRKDFYENREHINKEEKEALALSKATIPIYNRLESLDAIIKMFALIPDFKMGIQGVASSPVADLTWGSSNLVRFMQGASSQMQRKLSKLSQKAGLSSTMGSYKRRQEEWDLQVELATKELEQIDKQIEVAKIRLAIAEKDLDTHQLQIENAKTEGAYLKSKYTNKELYSWMVSQISTIYFQAYQLAYDMAKRAEKSFKYELALPNDSTNYIKFGYWDSLKKGLLSGDKLMLAIHKMEAAYIDQNKRELELTKQISLRRLAPASLLELITTGECTVDIPEWWFDMDFAGHYMRRIKAMSISIPCVVGPYTNINCVVSLENHSTRTNAIAFNGDYTHDNNYEKSFSTIESVAISHGQNDSGLFELNFNDERYLPFEGAGVISRWKLKLPTKELAQFDYSSITDVVLHMRYTARDGGQALGQLATNDLKTKINTQLVALKQPATVLSLKQEFATAWHRFIYPDVSAIGHELSFSLDEKHFPYFTRFAKQRAVTGFRIYIFDKSPTPTQYIFDVNVDTNSTTGNTVSGNSDMPTVMSLSSASTLTDSWRITMTDITNNPSNNLPTSTKIEMIEDIIIVFDYIVDI